MGRMFDTTGVKYSTLSTDATTKVSYVRPVTDKWLQPNHNRTDEVGQSQKTKSLQMVNIIAVVVLICEFITQRKIIKRHHTIPTHIHSVQKVWELNLCCTGHMNSSTWMNI